MMKLVSLFALFAVAIAGDSKPTLAKGGLRGKLPAGMPPSAGTTTCTAVCTKSATDSDFVKKYIAQAEEAAKTLQGKLAEQGEARANEKDATNKAMGANKAALKSKASYDKSGFLGFFKSDVTAKNSDAVANKEAKGARVSAEKAASAAKTARGNAEDDIVKANQANRDATNSVIDSCVLACDAARAAAKKVFEEHPKNKLGVSAGLSIAAAGNEPEPKKMMNGKDYGTGFGNEKAQSITHDGIVRAFVL